MRVSRVIYLREQRSWGFCFIQKVKFDPEEANESCVCVFVCVCVFEILQIQWNGNSLKLDPEETNESVCVCVFVLFFFSKFFRFNGMEIL